MRRALLSLTGIFVAIAVAGWAVGRVITPPNNIRGPLQGVDDWVQSMVLAHRTPSMIRLGEHLKNLGNPELLIPLVAVITVVLLLSGLRIRAFAPALSLAGTGLLVEPLKYAIRRPVPIAADPVHLAWPSGHTAGITAVVVPLAALAWVTRRWWWPSVVAAGFIVTVSTTMLVINAHWLTDVVGGVLIAGAWAVAVVVLLPDRIGTSADSYAPRRDEVRTSGHPPQPPPWHRPAEWMP